VSKKPFVSKRRANSFFYAVLLLMLAVIGFTQSWWPGITLAIGTALCFKNFLLKGWRDLIANAIIFGGIYSYYQYNLDWELFLPVMFILSAIFVLFREFTPGIKQETEVEIEEELNQEIEEEIE